MSLVVVQCDNQLLTFCQTSNTRISRVELLVSFCRMCKILPWCIKSCFWTFVSSFHSEIFCCSFGFLTFTLSFEEESKRSGHVGAEKF